MDYLSVQRRLPCLLTDYRGTWGDNHTSQATMINNGRHFLQSELIGTRAAPLAPCWPIVGRVALFGPRTPRVSLLRHSMHRQPLPRASVPKLRAASRSLPQFCTQRAAAAPRRQPRCDLTPCRRRCRDAATSLPRRPRRPPSRRSCARLVRVMVGGWEGGLGLGWV